MTQRRFTAEKDAEIAHLYNAGLSSIKIAKELKVDKSTVLESLKRSGVERRNSTKDNPRPLLSEEKVELAKIYTVGKATSTQIAKAYHRSITQTYAYLKQLNIESRGSRNFTDDEERQIADEYKSGISARRLAKLHNVPGKTSIIGTLRRQGVSQRNPSERNRLYTLNPNVFDIITADAAYWWGFLYADGTVGRKKTLVVGLKSTEANHLEKLKVFLESQSPIGFYDKYIKEKQYHSAVLSVTDRHLAERLMELGIVPERCRFSSAIQHLPTQYYRDWMRGFLDGDGSIVHQQNNQYQLGFSGQQDVLEWIQEHLACQLGISRSPIHKHTISDHKYLKYVGNVIASKVAQYLYAGATTYLGRKRDKALEIHPLRYKAD